MKYLKVIALLVFLTVFQLQAQEKLTKEERKKWFQDAELGVFRH